MTDRQLITVRTTSVVKTLLKRLAQEQGKSLNQLMTEMLERQLADETDKVEAPE